MDLIVRNLFCQHEFLHIVFLTFLKLEYVRRHTIKQLPQASPDLCMPLNQSTAISRQATGLFSKTLVNEMYGQKHK